MSEACKENSYSLPYKVTAEKVAKKEVLTSLYLNRIGDHVTPH